MRRMLQSLVRRASSGDLFALEALANIRRAMPGYVAQAAAGAHDGEAHYSWTEIAAELGITRQGARQLYADAKGIKLAGPFRP